jgi:RNA polymerase sigma-70 factor (ECF subfamily)
MTDAAVSDPLTAGEWEGYRVELTGYCYRMLGSPFDAEDAVQETFFRAWRGRSEYDESRASVRTWLYRIATNHCLDVLKSARRRRELAVEMGPAFPVGPELGTPLPEKSWVLPVPDDRVLPDTADPAEHLMLRESIRLAFIAALQLLPARQRAVLILRDVLTCSAIETADILDTSVASVTSALQRARDTLATKRSTPAPLDPASESLLRRYCEAFENDDINALVELLHEDATTSMPPYPWWLHGRAAIEAALRAAGNPCAGSRIVPVHANGTTAVAQYKHDTVGLKPLACDCEAELVESAEREARAPPPSPTAPAPASPGPGGMGRPAQDRARPLSPRRSPLTGAAAPPGREERIGDT